MTDYRFVTKEVRPGLWRAEYHAAHNDGRLHLGPTAISKTAAVCGCAREFVLRRQPCPNDALAILFAAMADAMREIHEESPPPLTIYRVHDEGICVWEPTKVDAINTAYQRCKASGDTQTIERVPLAPITAEHAVSALNGLTTIHDCIDHRSIGVVKIVRPKRKDPLAEARQIIESIVTTPAATPIETLKRAAKWLDANPEKDGEQ